jgi:hypothetical protein
MSSRSSKLGGSAGAVMGYLTEEEQVLDYYGVEKDKPFSTTWGKLAEEFGLDQGLTREQFTRLFHGQDPHTGQQLAGMGHRINRNEDGDAMSVTRIGCR